MATRTAKSGTAKGRAGRDAKTRGENRRHEGGAAAKAKAAPATKAKAAAKAAGDHRRAGGRRVDPARPVEPAPKVKAPRPAQRCHGRDAGRAAPPQAPDAR